MVGMPTYGSPPSISEAKPVETSETSVEMKRSFIRHQIDMEIYDIMYQVSQQLVDTV